MYASSQDDRVAAWLAALEERYLSDLTPQEVARALRALSSCYVERRGKLATGGALEGSGKRAAFALFYAPMHLFVVRQILQQLALDHHAVGHIYDLGCGTGAAGAAWGLEAPAARILGADSHPWAVGETNWTYRQLGLAGRAARRDLTRIRFDAAIAGSRDRGIGGSQERGMAIVAAYVLNELSEAPRSAMLRRLLEARKQGAAVLIVEPISRRTTPWWDIWEAAFTRVGGRADEWRFLGHLPDRQRLLAKAAGLKPLELTARTLFMST